MKKIKNLTRITSRYKKQIFLSFFLAFFTSAFFLIVAYFPKLFIGQVFIILA